MSSNSMLRCIMQGATTVVSVYYTPATYVARLTKRSTKHNATLADVKVGLRGRARAWYVEYAIKVLRPREVSARMQDPPYGTQ
jgi:hypothetical protein